MRQYIVDAQGDLRKVFTFFQPKREPSYFTNGKGFIYILHGHRIIIAGPCLLEIYHNNILCQFHQYRSWRKLAEESTRISKEAADSILTAYTVMYKNQILLP